MKDNRNIAITVLGLSALVLLAVLVGSQLQTPSAYADASVKQNDYIMVNGSVAQGSDVVYVINIPSRKMLVYFPDRSHHTLGIVDALDLDAMFKK